MRQIQEGGFQSRPYKSRFFFCVLCTAIRDNLRGVRKFSEGSPRRRGGRRVKSFLVKIHSELRELRVSAVKSLLPFGCGFAALRSLREKQAFPVCLSSVKFKYVWLVFGFR